ncbi:Histone-lysine N-methyltransferase 2B [Mucuna pruriens]|uniref:Histone-lysine N-methyltransferase 2B n=1 Tax=Mucuna pruriens TaxID=157652 RepID=A0A371H3T1_MUCPR|nr:Histone-lysine N-methyltransferase 2B [Mucuna pruriens]
MAFHVACPITCRRICFCALGFPRALHAPDPANAFLHDVAALREFLADTRSDDATVQVPVPKVVPPPLPLPPPDGLPLAADALDESASMKAKRIALQRKGAAAMLAAEEYARRFESGDVVNTPGNLTGEEQGQSNRTYCRICKCGENEGSEKAQKMLSCKSCGKKYHRNCLRSWGRHRGKKIYFIGVHGPVLFAEFVRRTGDPSKFMFCKRCDGAYHCYCLQPPHKSVCNGPYLCTKHARCHSCGSNVPGNGLSVRWFMAYTCCDACGRLFTKGNYCPVCLKVYRDSESTPMVCCDTCQLWVHCQCDNISDEKYHHFQVDGNLQYKCPTCRGECYKVKNPEDAAQEIWRRRNISEKDLIASLRAAAGLPTQEEIFSISPFSDDEDSGPLKLKSESARSFKFSLKNLTNDSPKKSSSKKTAKKKDSQSLMTSKIDAHNSFDGHSDIKSLHSLDDDKNDDIQSQRNEGPDVYSSPATGSLSQTEASCPINQPGLLKHKFVDEVMVSDEERKPRVVRIKSNKAHILDSEEESGKQNVKTQNVKGKKLVINLGARKINVASSPRSDTSSCQKDQDPVAVNGNEDISQWRKGDKFALDRQDGTARHIDGKGNRVDSGLTKIFKVSGREGNLIKLGKVKPDVSDGRVKLSTDGMIDQVGIKATSRGEKTHLGKQSEGSSDACDETDDNNNRTPSHSLPKDSKPLLRFKFKKPSIESQNSPHREEEKMTIKGQRSKRKRPSPFKEKTSFSESENVGQTHQDSVMDEIMDANWILMKLGNDAIGKRVEVHQTSDNSWHKGVVTDVVEGTSKLYVALDDGKVKILDLRKQGVRFVPQKQKRSKT